MNTRITEAQARKAGFTLHRGDYRNTSDDRADRWYFAHRDDTMVDRRGKGFATKADALNAIYDRILAAVPF
jgi:hypothetical protein